VIWVGREEEIFLRMGLDRWNQIEFVRKITFCALKIELESWLHAHCFMG
jgi:hypothetical protein